jgi:RNA recognition motif-containing protein
MCSVIVDGLPSDLDSDRLRTFCQTFGRVLHCYINSLDRGIITFAESEQAADFIEASPHRIDGDALVRARWQTVPTSNIESCRLTIRGNGEQLQEKVIIDYFSTFGPIRMYKPPSLDTGDNAQIIFDDVRTCQRVLQQQRHFLLGQSLLVEPVVTPSTRKRTRPNESTEHGSSSLLLEERIRSLEHEKQQYEMCLVQQQQQIAHCQCLLARHADESMRQQQQIDELTQENKDLE